MIKGFLVDIDGTLLDSNEAHAKTWAHAFEKFGYKVTADEVRSLIGMGGDHLMPSIAPELNPEEGKGKELSDYRKKCVLECVAPDLQPTPGARELIQALKKKGMRLVIASSASDEELHTFLKQAHVDDLLDQYVTSSEVASSKPSPDVVALALKKSGLSQHEVYMLGDSPYDIASAKKNGIATVAVRSGGFSDKQLHGAAFIFNDPKDVLQHLEEVLQSTAKTLHLSL